MKDVCVVLILTGLLLFVMKNRIKIINFRNYVKKLWKTNKNHANIRKILLIVIKKSILFIIYFRRNLKFEIRSI